MLIISLIAIMGQSAQVALPPRNALVERVSDGVKFLETKSPWYGVRYSEVIEPKETDITRQIVLKLLVPVEELEGYVTYIGRAAESLGDAIPGAHTGVTIGNRVTLLGQSFRSNEVRTVSSDSESGEERMIPVRELNFGIQIRPDHESALSDAKRRRSMAAGRIVPGTPLPSGETIGAIHWFNAEPTRVTLRFVLGRCDVRVFLMGSEGIDAKFVEKIARMLEKRIRSVPILVPEN